MQPRERDRVLILDMIDQAEIVASFVAGRARADLDRDRMLFYALVRAIEVMGEAASQLSSATRVAEPHIPWRQIIGLRNRLIHAYAQVDADIVWTVATVDVPAMLPALRVLTRTDEGE